MGGELHSAEVSELFDWHISLAAVVVLVAALALACGSPAPAPAPGPASVSVSAGDPGLTAPAPATAMPAALAATTGSGGSGSGDGAGGGQTAAASGSTAASTSGSASGSASASGGAGAAAASGSASGGAGAAASGSASGGAGAAASGSASGSVSGGSGAASGSASGGVGGVGAGLPGLDNPHRLGGLPAEGGYGDYAVGTATSFAVDNRQRFDPWNTAYASAGYREVLRRIEASGQRRTVVFQLWYPAVADVDAGRIDGLRSPYPALGASRRADQLDFFFRDEAMLAASGGGYGVNAGFTYTEGGRLLAAADATTQAAVTADINRRTLAVLQNAWLDAAPAAGKFPVIVIAHGLGGNHAMWRSYAEFLTSHGYIVAAPTFISDGSLPQVFHDPASPFANSVSPAEVRETYAALNGEFKVVPGFFALMFGVDPAGGFEALANFDPATAAAVPGGVERATTMMRNLFRQRVSDVGLVAHTVGLLGAEPGECRAALTAMGAVTAASELCGRLAGRVDAERVGLSGHSLGSMTAQLGANHLPGVRAALGINNAPPFTWTPEEMFGSGVTEDGLPVGSRAPVLNMIGDEDDFVQSVFVGIFQNMLAAAGGDPKAAFPLEPERATPERMENPQPVALSAYRRATGDRVFLIVRDTDHGTLVDDIGRDFPWPAYQRGELPFGQSPVRVRKATGEAAYGPPGSGEQEAYYQMNWAEAPEVGEVYLPHLVRDWYARNWFDWYLKDDAAARQRLQEEDPFGSLTFALREVE